MFKSILQQAHERHFGGSSMPQLDPAVVAANFGVAYPAGESLPENRIPVGHIEDDVASSLLSDDLKPPKNTAPPRSLYALAIARLNSIKPRTKARAQEVAQAIADLAEPFQTVDELLATLEMERNQGLEERREELRVRGRALRERIGTELQANLNTAMMHVNEAEEIKGRVKTKVQTLHEEWRSVKKNRFSTAAEIEKAESKLASAKKESEAAAAQALKAQQGFAEAENALKLAQSELAGIEIAMDQCVAELNGVPYHSPELGLSVDPTARWEQ